MRNKVYPISVLMVDDHLIVRQGYRALFSTYDNIQIVAEASTGELAYQNYKHYQPDVVVMDINLPTISGIETINKLKKYNSQLKLLVFSMHDSALIANQAMLAGAKGYITKSNPPETLAQGIQAIFSGKLFLSDDIQKKLAIEQVASQTEALKRLTSREFEILRLLVAAKPTTEIAKLLNISPKTAANCHYQIKAKLDVANDIELTHLAIKSGIINPDDVIN